jgi:hypothetical protein
LRNNRIGELGELANRQRGVLVDRQRAEERRLLERDANLPSDRGQFGLRTRGEVDTADHDAAAVGPFETDDTSEQRRLARSAPPEQRHDFAAVDVETDAIEHASAAVGDRDVAD